MNKLILCVSWMMPPNGTWYKQLFSSSLLKYMFSKDVEVIGTYMFRPYFFHSLLFKIKLGFWCPKASFLKAPLFFTWWSSYWIKTWLKRNLSFSAGSFNSTYSNAHTPHTTNKEVILKATTVWQSIISCLMAKQALILFQQTDYFIKVFCKPTNS